MFTLSLHRVRDTLRVRENGESLTLHVDADAMRMTAALNDIRKRLAGVTESTDLPTQRETARAFAAVLFGDEQAARLMAFYSDDPACVIGICGQYFSRRLSKLIRRAQVRGK